MQADRHTPWLPSAERDKEDPELAAVLRQVRDKVTLTIIQFAPLFCVHCLRQIRQHVACHDRAALSHVYTSSLHHCLRVMPMPCITAGLDQQ